MKGEPAAPANTERGVWARFREGPRTDRGVWCTTFVVVLGLAACWALASPYFSGPDEPAHVVRAYSVAHGEVVGRENADPDMPGLTVDVPAMFARSNPGCFAFQRWTTAECLSLEPDTSVIEANTFAGRHPPLYYGLAGLPSWFAVSGPGLMSMRLVSGALAAALLASAMVTARRRPWLRWMPAGIVVAVTPMAMYLFGLVNPNGLEIAAAIGAWVGGLALIGEERIDRRVLLRFVLAAAVLVLTRHLGPLWIAVLGGSLVLLAGWRRTWQLLRDRGVQIGLGVLAVVGVAQMLWLVVVDPLDAGRTGVEPLTATDSDIGRASIGQLGMLLREWVGLFGWLDTMAPEAVYFAWVVVLGALVLACLSGPAWRTSGVLLLLVAAMFVVPLALEYPNVRDAGFFWQGRYGLPLIVGIPLVAAYGMSLDPRRLLSPRAPAALVAGGLLVMAHFLAFAQALRRYTVGDDATLWFFTSEVWSPPVPSLLLLAADLVLVLAWVWLGRPHAAPLDPGTSPPREPSDGLATTGRGPSVVAAGPGRSGPEAVSSPATTTR